MPTMTRRSVIMDDLNPEEIKELLKGEELKDFRGTDRVALEAFLGVPAEMLSRKVLIYKPAKTATQHGWAATKQWVMKFSPGPQWTNPLMGWTSTSDPLTEMSIKFPTKEAALAFAAENGFDSNVSDEEHNLRKNQRTYGSKFRYEPPVTRVDELDLH
jgi:NADH dehydrogenase